MNICPNCGLALSNEEGMSRRLKERRLARGYTQGALSKATGICKASISRIESGKTNPDVRTLAALCLELECTMDYIVQGESSEN